MIAGDPPNAGVKGSSTGDLRLSDGSGPAQTVSTNGGARRSQCVRGAVAITNSSVEATRPPQSVGPEDPMVPARFGRGDR